MTPPSPASFSLTGWTDGTVLTCRKRVHASLIRLSLVAAEVVKSDLNARVDGVSSEGEFVPSLGFGDEADALVGGAKLFEKAQTLSSVLG